MTHHFLKYFQVSRDVFSSFIYIFTMIKIYCINRISSGFSITCIERLNIHVTHVTVNNSINNNNIVFFVSDLKIVYYNNY